MAQAPPPPQAPKKVAKESANYIPVIQMTPTEALGANSHHPNELEKPSYRGRVYCLNQAVKNRIVTSLNQAVANSKLIVASPKEVVANLIVTSLTKVAAS